MVVIISCMTEYSSEQCQISSYFVLKYCFFFLLTYYFMLLCVDTYYTSIHHWLYGMEVWSRN